MEEMVTLFLPFLFFILYLRSRNEYVSIKLNKKWKKYIARKADFWKKEVILQKIQLTMNVVC